jgi:hypothetical protein
MTTNSIVAAHDTAISHAEDLDGANKALGV